MAKFLMLDTFMYVSGPVSGTKRLNMYKKKLFTSNILIAFVCSILDGKEFTSALIYNRICLIKLTPILLQQ